MGAALLPLVFRPVATADEPAGEAVQFFDRELAPLLARRCLECHNPAEKKGGLDLTNREAAIAGGDNGPAIEPGKPDESGLVIRVEAGEMPPKHPLPAAERQTLRRWIESGATWGAGNIDRFRYTSDARAGYDWWSLQPPIRPQVPQLEGSCWPRGDVDRFVLAQLQQRDLKPSSEADRRTLIRRLSFDLIGLPPSPEEVDAFVDDVQPDAYEQLVARLLDSPQYGVRWARHWLDVIRFGESNGFEYDEFRRDAWPYRDWIVRSLNSDLPYDEFARLQLAGDVLRPDDLDATIAAGFLAAGAFDTAGQGQQSLAMRAVVRQDEMEDLVGTVGQTFLALTVNCARCHDHKFDPIRQREYYALVAALSGVRQGNRELASCKASAERAAEIASADAQRQELLAQVSAIETPLRERIAAERSQVPVDLRPFAHWDFATASPELKLHGSASMTDQGLVLDGQTGYASASLDVELREKTLEVWVQLANLDQRGGAAMSVQTPGGAKFDAIVFGENEPGKWLAGSDNFSRTQPFAATVESEVAQPVHVCITYAADGTIAAYRNGRPYGTSYRSGGTAHFADGKTEVIFGLRHAPAAPGKLLAGTISQARLYDRALTPDEVAASSGRFVPTSTLRERMTPDEQSRYEQLKQQLARVEANLSVARPAKVYGVKPQQPEPTHLLVRGNPAQRGEVVAAGGVSSLAGLSAEFGLGPDAPEAERRRRLAAWITSPGNPLFARAMVNRLWQYHFGVGLVETSNDFGFNGGRPANVQLLDWLATELVAQRYSLKAIHRLIVTSAAYRQSSRHQSDAARLDADNRLLWRKTPVRLEAEAVRDAMLHTAGVLDLSLGGPGFQEMKMEIAPGTSTYLYPPDDPTRDAFKRRTLYRVWARSGRNALLDAFDCPDPSTTAPRRAVTTTPLQALALLNNAFVLHVCDKFVERLQREAADDPARQVTRAYRLAYARRPLPDEQAAAERVVREHGLDVLARVLFNSNEFIYVD